MSDLRLSVTLSCAVCEKKKDIMGRCTRCRKVFYCSRECQIKDWTHHRGDCQNNAESASDLSREQLAGAGVVLSPDVEETEPQNRDSKNIWEVDKPLQLQDCQEPTTASSTMSSLLSQTESTSAYTSRIDFQKAVKDIKNSLSVSQMGKEDQRNLKLPETSTSTRDDCQTLKITVKANKDKYIICLQTSLTGDEMIRKISQTIQIPVGKLKLVHKGKMVTPESISGLLSLKSVVLQAIGERAESEEGLEPRDIEVLMEQLKIERNEAIKALRKTGDVVDAILFIGNKN